MPRPFGYSIVKADVLETVCERMANGRTLRDVARDPDMPSHEAIYHAMRRDANIADAIARARSLSAHGLAESVVNIADECNDPAMAQLVRNRCDQRRWLAAKYNNAYADKQEVVHSGQVDHVLEQGTALMDTFGKTLERRGKVIEHEPPSVELSMEHSDEADKT